MLHSDIPHLPAQEVGYLVAVRPLDNWILHSVFLSTNPSQILQQRLGIHLIGMPTTSFYQSTIPAQLGTLLYCSCVNITGLIHVVSQQAAHHRTPPALRRVLGAVIPPNVDTKLPNLSESANLPANPTPTLRRTFHVSTHRYQPCFASSKAKTRSCR